MSDLLSTLPPELHSKIIHYLPLATYLSLHKVNRMYYAATLYTLPTVVTRAEFRSLPWSIIERMVQARHPAIRWYGLLLWGKVPTPILIDHKIHLFTGDAQNLDETPTKTQKAITDLACNGYIPAQIMYICMLYPPLRGMQGMQAMQDWYRNINVALFTVPRLGIPYTHSKLKMKYHALAPQQAVDIYLAPALVPKTPYIRQEPASISPRYYTTMMHWIGEVCHVNDFNLRDCLRVIYIINSALCAMPHCNPNSYQLVTVAALMIMQYINGHTTTTAVVTNELRLAWITDNTYTSDQVLSMLSMLSSLCLPVLYMDIPVDDIPSTRQQYHIYTKDFMWWGGHVFTQPLPKNLYSVPGYKDLNILSI